MVSPRRETKDSNVKHVNNFDIGDLIEVCEQVVTYNSGEGRNPTHPGYWLPAGTFGIIVQKKLWIEKNWVEILCERGVTWLHPSTFAKVLSK